MAGVVEAGLSTLRGFAASDSDADLSWKLDCVALGLFVLSASSVQLMPAPYGRYVAGWMGPRIPARVAWLFECPSFIIPVALAFASGSTRASALPNAILITLFAAHYINRVLIYPQILVNPSPTPLLAAIPMFFFGTINGVTQGVYLTRVRCYPDYWLYDPRFIVGITLMVAGMSGNIYCDHVICDLRRKTSGRRYVVPHGFLFNWLVAPNYACEILEWIGWALAAWGTAPMYFCIFCLIFLSTRANHHHRYYRERLKKEFPSDRKILIPFVY